ncbi:MAG: aspartate carbamoyltransferase [Candidatus Hermodarchaeota archaeon]
MVSLSVKNLISIADLSTEEIIAILDRADKMETIVNSGKPSKTLAGKILAALFYEPSTRTRLSFESAMARLGGSSITVADIGASSVAKGESLADTIRTIENYADVIVLRHPQEGAAQWSSEVAKIPVINAGDGAGRHPTQTLLDLSTIRRSQGKLENLNIAMLGDLRFGRTVHSLSYAITRFTDRLYCIAPEGLELPAEIAMDLREQGKEVIETTDLQKILPELDVLYVTRIQKERFPTPADYEKVSGIYRIDNELLKDVKPTLDILHPLPRVDEIAPEVDDTPYARYFIQMFHGVLVRMAILTMLLEA